MQDPRPRRERGVGERTREGNDVGPAPPRGTDLDQKTGLYPACAGPTIPTRQHRISKFAIP